MKHGYLIDMDGVLYRGPELIPGADDFNSPTPNPDGSFDHGVIAAKGNRVMFIDKATDSATRDPFVDAMAQLQYAKL